MGKVLRKFFPFPQIPNPFQTFLLAKLLILYLRHILDFVILFCRYALCFVAVPACIEPLGALKKGSREARCMALFFGITPFEKVHNFLQHRDSLDNTEKRVQTRQA